MEQPTERDPLVIRGGLDGATVLIRVEPEVQEFAVWRWLLLALTVVLTCLGLVWIGLFLGVAWVGWTYLTWRGPQPEILHLKVDRSGVQVGGRRVTARCDFMTLWLDEATYTIKNGLTREEHQRLQQLFEPQLKGDRSDVPEQLHQTRKQRS